MIMTIIAIYYAWDCWIKSLKTRLAKVQNYILSVSIEIFAQTRKNTWAQQQTSLVGIKLNLFESRNATKAK